MKIYFTFFLFVLVILTTSCNLYNPPEQVPAYIHIDSVSLTTTSLQGTTSNRITDAWVYIDDQLVGCFQLPATFPVLFEGTHQLKVSAGIKVNGIAATRAPYPFYTQCIQSINLQKGSTTIASPVVEYASYAHLDFMEDFEGLGIAIDSSDGSNTTLKQIDRAHYPDVFEGDKSGITYITPQKPFFECVSSQTFALPKSGSNVFLEFNYKADHEFLVGVIAQPPYYLKTSALTFNASNTWKKTYLYLTTAVSSSPNATQFKIFFGMINDTNSDSLSLVLDNIKLIY